MDTMPAESTTLPAARVRAGGLVISLCAGPLNVPILRAHADGPLRLPELRERIGGAPQTTLRGHVGNLRGIGALAKRERRSMPLAIENQLTEAGTAILSVAEVLEAWLARAPLGPIPLGSEPAKGAIRALIGGWGSTMLRALATRPLSLTELDGLIANLSYPAIERRLSAMRAARQIEALSGQGVGRPYTVTDWARQAVAPLVVASRCECLHMEEEAEPATDIDIEAAFLLAVPLVMLPEGRSGSCLLAMDTGSAEPSEGDASEPKRRLAGVRVKVENGRVTSCVSELERDPRTWALGTVETWLDAIIDGQFDHLRIGGEDPELVRALLRVLHASLFSVWPVDSEGSELTPKDQR
jgi:DNA-binding HxlR family transcriptional regulator